MIPWGSAFFPGVDPSAIRWAPGRLSAAAADWPLGRRALRALGWEERARPVPGRYGQVFGWWQGATLEPGPVPVEAEGIVAGHASVWRHVVAERPVPDALLGRFVRTPLSAQPPLEEVAARGLCVGGAPGRALVEAHLSQLKRGIRISEVLPDAWSLWTFADAVARLRGSSPRDAPLAALGLPWDLLRETAVTPLADWLGGASPDEETAGALLLVLASGDSDRYWYPPGG